MIHVLTAKEMAASDQAAIEAGTAFETLMDNAGWQVARLVRQHFAPRKTVVLCGPGNNGGDGKVAARYLARWGWPVSLEPDLDGDPLVIDALFGAGLARPLEGKTRQLIEAINQRGLDVVAVDLPSGVHSDSGEILGAAPQSLMTVTFAALKPGHLLLPGRELCGHVVLTDIGVTPLASNCFHNGPELWLDELPEPQAEGHKYSRGHLLVAGGAELTGAARLAVWAGRRIGAGLATVAAPPGLEEVYRIDHPGTMVRPLTAWPDLLADARINAAVIGPGLGVGEQARRLALQALSAGKACVLDADAITSFADDPGLLWSARGDLVLTPHDGEFARLFSARGDRLSRARAAAKESGAVVVLKGSDSVVAAPDGRAAIASNAPPDLATGGTGDVLAGVIGGLLAQGMESFEAACAAVWLQGDAAKRFGRGLVAEDLIECLPGTLSELQRRHG